jgi:NAD(P)H-hydrate epimerase
MLPFQEVKVLDINSEYLGVPIDALMENAGEAAADAIIREMGTGKKIAVACGVGNNAGDGFVAARNLMRDNQVTVVLASPPAEIHTEAARRAYERVKHIASSSVGIDYSKYDIVVDALLGTGTLKEVREPYRTIINRLNNSGTTIVSIDVPSGLLTDISVRPHMTITFTDVKSGMTAENSGKIVVEDIGIPLEASRFVGPGELVYYPTRGQESHKGENGKVLIIGGGPFTGAPALSGLAAYRTGVDLVNVAVPEKAYYVVAGYSPNIITHKLHGDFLTEEDVDHCMRLASKSDAVLIGPGLGNDPSTMNAVRSFVSRCDRPMVIDADAIPAVGADISVLKGKTGVITPHAKEFEALTGSPLPKDHDERGDAVTEAAARLGFTILAKRRIDIISDGITTKFNRTGNAGMSVAGTGDVLAGETVALLSKQVSPFNSARIAAFLNGTAGDLAFQRLGYSIMATDVIEQIPDVLRRSLRKLS